MLSGCIFGSVVREEGSFFAPFHHFSGKLLTFNLQTESMREEDLLVLCLNGKMPAGCLGPGCALRLEFELIDSCRKVAAATSLHRWSRRGIFERRETEASILIIVFFFFSCVFFMGLGIP